jgi:TPR repeat protein
LAQGELGICYYTGQGMPLERQTAFTWFLRAAEAGVARAQEFVGEMYERGDGVAKSDAKAVVNDRALVGCLWNELSYIQYGHC